MLTVSGFQKDISYQECTRCICDNTIPGLSFDSKGVCSLCDIHDRFDATFPNDERGAAALDAKFAKIKKEGECKKHDCIIGISGGRDSIFVKRHGFGGVGEATHGQHNRLRAPGSIGASSFPSKVFKGMRMAGRMGNDQVTVRNLTVAKIFPEQNLIIVKGAVPGHKGSYVIIEK